jgi:hypothetical protein
MPFSRRRESQRHADAERSKPTRRGQTRATIADAARARKRNAGGGSFKDDAGEIRRAGPHHRSDAVYLRTAKFVITITTSSPVPRCESH